MPIKKCVSRATRSIPVLRLSRSECSLKNVFNYCGFHLLIIQYEGRKDVKQAVTINLAANDEMTITPYQVAPCYMKSTDSSKWQLLKLGTSVPIKPGYICSLLPNKCWLKVVSVSSTMEENQEHASKRKANGDINSDVPSKKSYLESLPLDASAGETVNQNIGESKHETVKGVDNENKDNNKDAGDSVVEIKEVHEASSSVDANEKHDSHVEEKVVDKGDACPEILEENSNETARVVESRDSPVPMDVDQPTSSVNINKNIQRRDKCCYGKSCYRKNPQHKTQFSHPGDSDYDTPDDRPDCPYGTRCYRKNPQHRKDFKHTKRVAKPRRKRTTPNRTSNIAYADESSEELSADESVDESEYEPTSEEQSSGDDSYWDQSGNGSELDDGTTG